MPRRRPGSATPVPMASTQLQERRQRPRPRPPPARPARRDQRRRWRTGTRRRPRSGARSSTAAPRRRRGRRRRAAGHQAQEDRQASSPRTASPIRRARSRPMKRHALRRAHRRRRGDGGLDDSHAGSSVARCDQPPGAEPRVGAPHVHGMRRAWPCHPHPARRERRTIASALAEVETPRVAARQQHPGPGHRGRRFGIDARHRLRAGGRRPRQRGDRAVRRVARRRASACRASSWPACSPTRAIDLTVGAIPVLGDAFDLWFKANTRNLAIMRRHLEQPELLDTRRLAACCSGSSGPSSPCRAHRLAVCRPHDGGRGLLPPFGVHDRS